MSDPLGVAVIGVGAIAEQAHLPAWSQLPSAKVMAVVDRDPERARQMADRWGIPRWYDDYRLVLEERDIHALDVCVPPAFHAEVTLAALEAGRHVLLEKPMTIDLDEAQRLVRAARSATSVLMIAENWPFASATRRALEILEGGTVGKPFLLRAHHESDLYVEEQLEQVPWLTQPEVAGRGYFMQAGIHTINLARFLLGEIEAVQALALPADSLIEHTLVLTARFEEEALGSMNFTGWSRHLGERRLEFRLFCTGGLVEFDIWSGRVSWTARGAETRIEVESPSRGFREEIQHFMERIRDGSEPLTSAADQLRTLAAVHAAYRSLETGGPVSPRELVDADA